VFLDRDPTQPVVVGAVHSRAHDSSHPEPLPGASRQNPHVLEVDAEQLFFTARADMVFRCGEASITLTRAGKVLIRGQYVLSRSGGVNAIKGGTVQIN
jgi:hypothetical protein